VSGQFDGPRLRGKVLPGSGDWTLLRGDGVLELDLRLTLATDDGALIDMRSFGLRHGPPDVIAAIGRGERVDPSTYYFRTTPRFVVLDPGLRDPYDIVTPDFRPGPDANATNGVVPFVLPPNDGFFEPARFIGAMGQAEEADPDEPFLGNWVAGLDELRAEVKHHGDCTTSGSRR
jgi:Protein of unknown function (DUF3237)